MIASSKQGIQRNKDLGQNYLTDRYVAKRIVDTIPRDTLGVLEIGPGRGILTDEMVKRGFRITAVEIDAALAGSLGERYADADLEIVNADILDLLDEGHIQRGRYIVSNLPFYISSQFMLRLLEIVSYPFMDSYEFCGATLMFQKEFATRLVSNPGSHDYSRISVSARSKLDIRRLIDVGRGSFDPSPSVDATVLLLRERKDDRVINDTRLFERVLERSFQSRRKKMKNLIPGQLVKSEFERDRILDWMKERGIDQLRPENLDVTDFIELSNKLSSYMAEGV